MKPRLLLEWLLRRLSVAGVLGLLLLAGAAWVWLIETPRLQAATAQAQRDLTALKGKLATQASTPPVRQTSDEERLAKFYAALVPGADVPKTLARLFALAQAAKITLKQGDFQRVENKPGKFVALQFNLPAKAGYGQLRDFIDAALTEMPALTLEEVVFKRETAANATLDATLKFVLYVSE